MQKNIVLPIFVALFLLGRFIVLPGYCTPDDNACEQLKAELKNAGVSDQFIRTTENSVKTMILYAAPPADIKTVLMDLWNEKVTGLALKNAVAAVAELVKSGDNVLEAAKIASGAAHKAEAEGLGGFGVGMRVKKAVQDRKAYLKGTGYEKL
jgi:hypothetical protein